MIVDVRILYGRKERNHERSFFVPSMRVSGKLMAAIEEKVKAVLPNEDWSRWELLWIRRKDPIDELQQEKDFFDLQQEKP